MVAPALPKLIRFQAKRFREEFEDLKLTCSSESDDNSLRIIKLEVNVFFLLHREALGKCDIDNLGALARCGRQKLSDRKKQYQAMGGAKSAGFSEDEFMSISELATKAF